MLSGFTVQKQAAQGHQGIRCRVFCHGSLVRQKIWLHRGEDDVQGYL